MDKPILPFKTVMRVLRSAAYAVYFFAVTLVFGLGGLAVRRGKQQRALLFAKAWVGTLLAGLRPICSIELEISGLEHLPPKGAALLACQHQSEFDTLVWTQLLQTPCFVMKQELTRTPLVGPMLVPAGMIPVDRAGGAGALRRLLQDTMAARDAGRQIVIFPEGTRVAAGSRVALQPGVAAIAARLGLAVIPVATNSGLHWPRSRLGLQPGPIRIAIGAPIPPGLPREKLLAAIEAFWRKAEETGFQPVDKSVDRNVANGGYNSVGTG
jgi:1-acyl-sn-glycerol-3-phosphate acyltransferase